jgi:GNAT superfamily N-acetyltransferase
VANVELCRVASRHELEAFVALPYALHATDSCFAPPLRRDVRALLDPARNPFFRHAERELFLARRGGRVVGRIAAIHDRAHCETHRDGAGFFGFFDAIRDEAVARRLLDDASSFLSARGLRVVRGPFSPSINEEAGMLVEGFSTPSVVMMPHNPSYYPELIEAAGFKGVKDLLAFERLATELPARLVAATDRIARRRGLSCRALEMKRFGDEVALVQRLFNASWRGNWGAVAMTDAEVAHLAAQLEPIVVPELVVFAEAEAKTVGFAAAIPDLNVALRANPSGRLVPGILKVLWAARRIRRLRVILLGVLPEWHGRGVDALLYRRIWESARALGYEWAEAGWVLEDNHAMRNGLARMGFRVYKRYRVYERPL